MPVVLFAGGGTGGHLMPALAIAEAMVAADPSIDPFFVGAERGIEARVLPNRRWRHVLLPFEPIYRNEWWKNVRLPVSVFRSVKGVRDVLRREQPVLAVGTGGYASGPSIWAAAGRGIPTVLQEQNAFPGFAIRRLSARARQIHLGFPEGRSFLEPGPNTEIFDSGNPINPPPKVRLTKDAAKKKAGFEPGRPLVLITGGSQGSLAINKTVAEIFARGLWPAGVQLLWHTGTATYDQFKHLTTQDHRVSSFIDPMADAYAAVDLLVGRGGAITAAEVAAWGLPSVVIPLPTSAADHQLKNGQALEAAGAAVLLEQKNVTAERLADTIGGLLADPARRAAIAAAALRRARPDAAADIARHALGLVRG